MDKLLYLDCFVNKDDEKPSCCHLVGNHNSRTGLVNAMKLYSDSIANWMFLHTDGKIEFNWR